MNIITVPPGQIFKFLVEQKGLAGWSHTCSSPPISSCRSLRGPCALLYPEQGRLQLEEETPNGNSTGSANELNGTLLADFLTIGFPIFSARSVSRIFSIYTPQILYCVTSPFFHIFKYCIIQTCTEQ